MIKVVQKRAVFAVWIGCGPDGSISWAPDRVLIIMMMGGEMFLIFIDASSVRGFFWIGFAGKRIEMMTVNGR
jgi:hypothetical protein